LIVAYNFVVGVLLVLSSQTIGRRLGILSTAHGPRISRLAALSVSALGAAAAVLSGGIYLFVHILRIGV
jgi:hypothetical protein